MPVLMFSVYVSHLQGPKAEAKQIPGHQYARPNVFTVCFLQAASDAKKKKGRLRYLYLHAPKR